MTSPESTSYAELVLYRPGHRAAGCGAADSRLPR